MNVPWRSILFLLNLSYDNQFKEHWEVCFNVKDLFVNDQFIFGFVEFYSMPSPWQDQVNFSHCKIFVFQRMHIMTFS